MAEPFDDDPRHWHLDKRLNLSHLITTLAMAASIMWWGAALDRRVAVLEEARLSQRQTDERQDADLYRTLNAMKEESRMLRDELRETTRKLDRLIERIPNANKGI